MNPIPRFAITAAVLSALMLAGPASSQGQAGASFDRPDDIQRALADAQNQGAAARQRAERFEQQAARVTEAAEQTAQQAASAAARIQEAEATIVADEARIGLIERQRRQLRERLAIKQQPLIRLTASLQRMARRPPVLSLLRPGSVRDAVYLRAILATMLPQVEQRTAALKAELEKARALQAQARMAVSQLRSSQIALRKRRESLAALETRQRLASRMVSGLADREAERSLALAERSRDLDSLSDELEKSGRLRDELAALAGPVLRPAQPKQAQVAAAPSVAAPSQSAPLATYVLPASGRLVSGFGEMPSGQSRTRGIALSVRQGAQAVAPASGRVVFAGPYRGYGSIVIVDHGGGWTSLITGLAQLDTRVGDRLFAGSPLGIAGAGRPVLSLELRRDGVPVNPLEYIRSL